jgi:hypothetical protein
MSADETPMLPHVPWRVHDAARPQPRVVRPGPPHPSDAIVLFDRTLSRWKGGPWRVDEAGGFFEVEPGAGDIETTFALGDGQYHLELAIPEGETGAGQDRGNSGIFLLGRYEIQVLDGFENPTYADGQIGAIYGQHPPLVNAARRPGEWQTLDAIWSGPRFSAAALRRPAHLTLLLNGVVVQHEAELLGPTRHGQLTSYEPHPETGPLRLQDHGSRVRFRNVWYRKTQLAAGG